MWFISTTQSNQVKSNQLLQYYISTTQNPKTLDILISQFLFLFLKKTRLRKQQDTFTRCHGIEPEEWKARSGTGHRAFFWTGEASRFGSVRRVGSKRWIEKGSWRSRKWRHTELVLVETYYGFEVVIKVKVNQTCFYYTTYLL